MKQDCTSNEVIIKNVANIEDLIHIIEEYEEEGKRFYFRGESSFYPNRIPTLYRQTNLIEKGSEYYYRTLLNELGRDDYGENTTLVRLISELQHYGAVTRILDITSNPLVALYFALEKSDKNGYLYIYSVEPDKEKFDTGHTVAIKCAMNLMDQEIIDNFLTACEFIKKLRKIESKNLYQKTTDEIESFQILKKEYDKEAIPLFMEILNQRARVRERLTYPFKIYEDLITAHLVLPSKTTERIRQQQGAFIFPRYVNVGEIKNEQHKQKVYKQEVYKQIDASIQELELKEKNNNFIRIQINSGDKDKLRKQLKILGITEGFIYPDIEHVSKALLQL